MSATADIRDTSTDLTQVSAAELAGLYRSKAASPVEVTLAVLARAEAVKPAHQRADPGRHRAGAGGGAGLGGALGGGASRARRWTASRSRSRSWCAPRAGRQPWAAGSPTRRRPSEDAPAVARLREAGAIVYAQNTSPEYGFKGVTDSPLHGVTRNPWNLERTPGRLVRRLRRGGGGRAGPAGGRHRRRRLGAHPLGVLRPRGPEGDLRPDPRLAALHARRPRQHRPDDPHHARLRADAEPDVAARSRAIPSRPSRRTRTTRPGWTAA